MIELETLKLFFFFFRNKNVYTLMLFFDPETTQVVRFTFTLKDKNTPFYTTAVHGLTTREPNCMAYFCLLGRLNLTKNGRLHLTCLVTRSSIIQ